MRTKTNSLNIQSLIVFTNIACVSACIDNWMDLDAQQSWTSKLETCNAVSSFRTHMKSLDLKKKNMGSVKNKLIKAHITYRIAGMKYNFHLKYHNSRTYLNQPLRGTPWVPETELYLWSYLQVK